MESSVSYSVCQAHNHRIVEHPSTTSKHTVITWKIKTLHDSYMLKPWETNPMSRAVSDGKAGQGWHGLWPLEQQTSWSRILRVPNFGDTKVGHLLIINWLGISTRDKNDPLCGTKICGHAFLILSLEHLHVTDWEMFDLKIWDVHCKPFFLGRNQCLTL